MEESSASHAGRARAQQLLGRVHLALGQGAEALTAFERAAALGGTEDLERDVAAARVGAPPPLRSLRGLPGPVAALALAPDGRTVAAGSGAEVRLWDAGTGQLLRTLPVPDGPVRALALLPDQRFLVVSVENAPLAVWDLASGRPVRSWARHAGFATSLAVLPGGRFVVSGGSDRVVRLWDPASGRPVREMAGHEDAVTAVAAGADAPRLREPGRHGPALGSRGRALPRRAAGPRGPRPGGGARREPGPRRHRRRRRQRARLGPAVPRARPRLPVARPAGAGGRPVPGRRAHPLGVRRPHGARVRGRRRAPRFARPIGGRRARARRGPRRHRLGRSRDDGQRPRREPAAPAPRRSLPAGLLLRGGGPRLLGRGAARGGPPLPGLGRLRDRRVARPPRSLRPRARALRGDARRVGRPLRAPPPPGTAIGLGGGPPRGPRRPGPGGGRGLLRGSRAHGRARLDRPGLGPGRPAGGGDARRPRRGRHRGRVRRRGPGRLRGSRSDGPAVGPRRHDAPSPFSKVTRTRSPRWTPPPTARGRRAPASTARPASGTCGDGP